MTCGSCKYEDVRNEAPCTGCSHGRWWKPKEAEKPDIVKVLRGHAYGLHVRHNELGADVADAAADEIERLRSTVATLNSALATTSEANARLQREADRPGIMWCNEP